MAGRLVQEFVRLRVLYRRLWARASFWGKASTILVVLCVFSIALSGSFTYQHQKQVAVEPQKRSTLAKVGTVVATHPPAPDFQQLARAASFLVPADEDTDDDGDAQYEPDTECLTENCDDVRTPIDSDANITTIIIGVLSDPLEDVEFRAAARATWLRTAAALDSVDALFFFPHSTDELRAEAHRHGDIVFGSGLHSDMPVAYQMLEFLAEKYEARHIMRVNVRSYVVVPRLLARLEQVCASPACAGEDIWAGRQIASREIPAEDRPYLEDTGLSMYLPYMSSGAYVVSVSLAASLSLMHNEIGLKWYDGEDVSLGVWLIPMAARRIDFGAAVHLEDRCCFDKSNKMIFDICSRQAEQYPIVLSVLERPEYVHQYHHALADCKR